MRAWWISHLRTDLTCDLSHHGLQTLREHKSDKQRRNKIINQRIREAVNRWMMGGWLSENGVRELMIVWMGGRTSESASQPASQSVSQSVSQSIDQSVDQTASKWMRERAIDWGRDGGTDGRTDGRTEGGRDGGREGGRESKWESEKGREIVTLVQSY